MSDKTSIEWTDATWNPTKGCDRVSPGCANCYAMTLAPRLKAMGSPGYQLDGDPRTSGPGFLAHEWPAALDQPIRWTKPRRIFVNSMSDLFHDHISADYIARVFAVMSLAPQHTFQLLTKRHGRMRSLLNSPSFEPLVRDIARSMKYSTDRPDTRMDDQNFDRWPLPNVWGGVSVEDQDRGRLRIDALLETPFAVRFLSCEPLLAPLTLSRWLPAATCRCGHAETAHYFGPGDHYGRTVGCQAGDGSAANPICGCRKLRGESSHELGSPYDNHGLHWVIVGGESGPDARPMHSDWARKLRDQCVAAGVPFLFKQWGGKTPKSGGRILDGRTWDEYPAVANA